MNYPEPKDYFDAFGTAIIILMGYIALLIYTKFFHI